MCPRYDTKPSDSEASVLDLWGMWSVPSLPLLSGLLCPGVVVPVRVSYRGQIELFNNSVMCKQMSSGLFKRLPNKLFTNIYLMCV